MAKDKIYLGGCLCGDVRFEATGMPKKPHSCSCKMCQRHSGALTAAWVEFDTNAVRWVGKASTPALFRSSDYSSRAFCAKCGSSIGAIDDAPIVALLLGVFDSPNRRELMPLFESFKTARPPWWHPEVSL